MRIIEDCAIDFAEYMASPPDAAKIKPAASWADDVIAKFCGNEDRQANGVNLPWTKTHGNIALRSGEVSLWTGMNGHGKSQLLGQVILLALVQGVKACIASLEMKPVATMARMTRQASATSRPSERFIREFHAWTDGKLWLYDQQGTVKSDRMLAVARFCHAELGVTHFVIDSLMKCGIGVDDYNRQKAFVDEITSLARDTGMHIHIVAHSRKGQDENTPPGKMDVKGASEITDQVDNVFSVWRNKRKENEAQKPNPRAEILESPDALLICDKQRHGEWEGTAGLYFHRDSLQYMGGANSRPDPYKCNE